MLPAYGAIEKVTIAGDYRHRWRVKLGNAAKSHVVSVVCVGAQIALGDRSRQGRA